MADAARPPLLSLLFGGPAAPPAERTGPPPPAPGGPVLIGDICVAVNGRPALLDHFPKTPPDRR